jgi:hypothetical protein
LGLEDLLKRDPVTRRRALKRLGARLPFRPAVRFLYLYLVRGGLLDGRAGFIYCLLVAAHQVHMVAKLEEALVNPRQDGSAARETLRSGRETGETPLESHRSVFEARSSADVR